MKRQRRSGDAKWVKASAPRFQTLLVDGYSLLHRDPEMKAMLDRDVGLARQLLVRRIERIAPDLASETKVVFDGTGKGDGEAYDTSLTILFAPERHTADTIIERLVHTHPAPTRVLVVTSDRMERQTVEAAGAETMSCGDFLRRDRAAAATTPFRKRRKGATLGDFFPPMPE